MRVCVTAVTGTFDTGLSSVLDTLQIAGELARAAGRESPFDLSVVGVRRRVTTQLGMRVPVAPLPRSRPDVVIVPALGAKFPEALSVALRERESTDLGNVLREWSRAGTLLAAACTGTFLVAQTGLLDDRHATTSWWLGPYFRERFPRVLLDDSKLVVQSRGCVTAGAALSHVDLALWLVRRHSPALARTTANYLTYDDRSSQTAFVMHDHLLQPDEIVERFEHWARKNLAAFSLAGAARAVGTSERTLERRLRQALGKSPTAFVQDLRVERAVHRLRSSQTSLEEIAAEVGYSDGVTLRTLLRRRTGRGVRELRR
ncbi:MAG TPA: helix-turn-helix domain-containing protein [Polyangiaceae bacterium]|nr:helix-turn-helix domain-containing protein [Polyangiaceae bacterium]